MLVVAVGVPAQDGAPALFRYRAGDVLVAVEHEFHREVDPRIGFAIARSHTVERRYTVLDVAEDGSAEVLVEEDAGPQRLHEYTVRGEDQRRAQLEEGFDPQLTVRRRVSTVRRTPERFRCEPARDEPAVYYLQELPELLAHMLSLPAGAQSEYTIRPDLPRLDARFEVERRGDRFAGRLALAIRDPRVRDGAEVRCPDGTFAWQLDAELGLPRSWCLELRYPRFPIDRPNELVVTGRLIPSAPLGAGELAALRADLAEHEAVRAAFFAGRFPEALERAERFLDERPASRLADQVRHEVDAFRRQVPRYGERPPELKVAAAFGGAVEGLEALRGQVVVVDFWATWCKPCIAGMGHLIDLQAELGGEGLRVLGLTRVDRQQTVDDVRHFAASGYADGHGGRTVDYPLAVLDGDALHDWFAVRAIPKLAVLDREGRVRWEQTGTGGEARLDRIVRAALAER